MRAIDNYLLYLSAERNLSPCTIRAYGQDLRQFIQFYRRARKIDRNSQPTITGLSEIDHLFLRRYLAYLQTKQISRRSVARKLAALRSFYRFLQHRYHQDNSSIELVASPKLEKLLPKVLSYGQIRAILKQIDTDSKFGFRDRTIVEFLYGAGIRVSELVSLDMGDVQPDQEDFKVIGKGSKERIAPLNNYMRSALNDYLKIGRSPLIKDKLNAAEPALFLNCYGTRLSSGGIRRMLKRYSAEAGLPNVTPHVFRHSFATHLLEGNAGLRAVQELLGHVDLSSTQIYTHLSKKQLKNIYSQAHPRA